MKSKISNSKLWQDNLITALGFSVKNNYCAVATKLDHIVRIYAVNNLNSVDSWSLLQQLKEHTQTISEVDWALDNKLISSSHDRSVVVWKQISDTKWEKMLVNIDIKLSILTAKWAPSTRKFALGSSCNTLSLGFFNNVELCWTTVNKMNFTKAPITTINFHPSCNLLAVGSADFSVKIVTSSFKKSKDQFVQKSQAQDFQYDGPFKNIDSSFEILLNIQNLGGWINYVSFENNGNNLLILPHTNHLKILTIADNQQLVVGEDDIRWNGLPFLSGFINQNQQLILGGFDKKVARFIKKGKYTFQSFLADNQKTNAAKIKKGIVANYTKKIESKTSYYSEGPSESQHVNSIKVINVNKMAVSYDINGIVHFWN